MPENSNANCSENITNPKPTTMRHEAAGRLMKKNRRKRGEKEPECAKQNRRNFFKPDFDYNKVDSPNCNYHYCQRHMM